MGYCNSVKIAPYRKALAVATTSTSFTAKVPTTTKPLATSTRSVVDLFSDDYGLATETYVPSHVMLLPYLTAVDNVTGDMRLWGWNKVPDGATPIWVPTLLCQLALVAGNIDASAIEASALLADTITATYGYGTSWATGINSPAGTTNLTGGFIAHCLGSELLEFDFDVGTATAANCLWRMVDMK
jgi:hypothetical protein